MNVLEKKRPIGKKSIIIYIVLGVIALVSLIYYLAYPIRVPYGRLRGGIEVTEEADGTIRIEYPAVPDGITHCGGAALNPVVMDYEYGVVYYYELFGFRASRIGLILSFGRTRSIVLTPDDFVKPEPSEDVTYYLENQEKMQSVPLRLYYENPDYTYVLLWENPEASEVSERCRTELEDPWEYVRKSYKLSMRTMRLQDILWNLGF